MSKVWTQETGWVFGVDSAKISTSHDAMRDILYRIRHETDPSHLNDIEGEALYDSRLVKQHLEEIKNNLKWRRRSI